jgi:GNAT superfamily N-acetyltransferase
MVDPVRMDTVEDDRYEWRGELRGDELKALHANGFGHDSIGDDWAEQLRRHSLGWVCARRGDNLIGFVNVAWDGGTHAFLLDTVVAPTERRRGVATTLVSLVRHHAAMAGCVWLHVDFEDHLRPLYIDTCGFRSTNGGLIQVNERRTDPIARSPAWQRRTRRLRVLLGTDWSTARDPA